MSSAVTAAVSTETSGALHAVGAVLGLPVTITDLDEWELDERGLKVGLGWYLQRGHGMNEAVALAALQLWEGPRETLRVPARARRRRAIERARPELRPLLGVVNRAQALSELLRAMPGLRVKVRAAVQRSLPGDLSTLPRHLQWATLVLAQQVNGAATLTVEDEAVADEWQRLCDLGGIEIDALRQALVPDPEVPPLRRFERVLALLLPSYERLLALDLAERSSTLLGGSDRAELSLHSQQLLGSDDFAPNDEAMSGDDSSDEDQQEAEAGESSGAAPSAADLFAFEHESFATAVISTPIPDASNFFDVAVQLTETAESDRSETSGTSAAGSGDSAEETILAEYRSRSQQLAGAIDSMRALWSRVIAERIAPRRSTSRIPVPEGDELATEALATVVADTLAGVREPSAFLRHVVKPRLTRSVGSTDYVLMIDRSASMSGLAAESAADAALIMIEALAAAERDVTHAERAAGIDLELDIRSSLIVFGAEAVVIKPLSRGLDDQARRRMHGEVSSPSGATNDAAALKAAGDQLGISGRGGSGGGGGGSGSGRGSAGFGTGAGSGVDAVQRRRIAILVSDGGSNDQAAAALELRRLRAAGVSVHGIGVGSEELAARYAPHGVSIANPRELPSALERIIADELG